MSEKDIERTEKKVDLFLKILLGLNIPRIGHPYNRKYIDNHIDELTPVYNLFAERDVIENYPTQEKIENWENKLKHELDKLKQDYEHGNFLAKEQDTIRMRIKDLGNKLEYLTKLSKNKENFEAKNTELYRINLFMDLQEKLGITEKYDSHSYRKLIRKKDDLKKNIQDLIEDLTKFLDNNKET